MYNKLHIRLHICYYIWAFWVYVTYALCMIYEYKQGLGMYVIHMSNKILTFAESVRFFLCKELTHSVLIVIQYFQIKGQKCRMQSDDFMPFILS